MKINKNLLVLSSGAVLILGSTVMTSTITPGIAIAGGVLIAFGIKDMLK